MSAIPSNEFVISFKNFWHILGIDSITRAKEVFMKCGFKENVDYIYKEAISFKEIDHSRAIAKALGGKSEFIVSNGRIDVLVESDILNCLIETKFYTHSTGFKQLLRYSKHFPGYDLFLIIINPVDKNKSLEYSKRYPGVTLLFDDELFFSYKEHLPSKMNSDILVTIDAFCEYYSRFAKCNHYMRQFVNLGLTELKKTTPS